MIEVIGIILGIATLLFVTYPVFFRRLEPVPSVSDERLQEMYSNRDTTYSMLKELEFDYNSGILTEEDYKDLESKYKHKAVSLLKGIDAQIETSDDLDAEIEERVGDLREAKQINRIDTEIERQVRKLRHSKPDDDAEIERQIQELRGSRTEFCHQCGKKSQEGDRFCRQCGTKLD